MNAQKIRVILVDDHAMVRKGLDAFLKNIPDFELVGEACDGKEAVMLCETARPDVILVARGGGSIEDLWAFNDERVVRAVAASELPIICGGGHETDFTLADFAADLRAPTPTAAAELATQITAIALKDSIRLLEMQLSSSIQNFIAEYRDGLSSASTGLRFYSPVRRIESDRQRLDEMARRAEAAEVHRLALQASALDGLEKHLQALNPVQVLSRGYAVVRRRQDGAVVSRVSQARDGILVRVSDGEFEAEVSKGSNS